MVSWHWEGATETVLEERGVGQDASSYTLLACGRRCFFPFTSWNFDIYVCVGRRWRWLQPRPLERWFSLHQQAADGIIHNLLFSSSYPPPVLLSPIVNYRQRLCLGPVEGFRWSRISLHEQTNVEPALACLPGCCRWTGGIQYLLVTVFTSLAAPRARTAVPV